MALLALKRNENRYLAISTELDYISDEEEPDPISTDSPINSSIEFELGDFFPAMATNYNAPTTSSASYAL